MARVALSIAGAAVGSLVGMPGLGATVGGALGGYLDQPSERITQEGPRIDDLHVQISSYGAAIPRVWGTMRLSGNMIWAAPIDETITNDEVSEGKGGPTVVQVKYSYYGTFAIGICVGTIDRLLRIWADSKLIYSVVPTNEQIVSMPGMNFRLYKGTETQEPDSWIEHYEGAGNVPGHRGMCYIVICCFPLEKFGNRVPNFSFDVTTQGVDDTSFTALSDIKVDPSAETEDHIVFAPDGVNFIVSHEGNWARMDTLSNALRQSAVYVDGGGDPEIPALLSESPTVTTNFDIDERNIIHAAKGHYIGGGGTKLCQLDGITLALIKEAASTTSVFACYLRVFQNPTYPFLMYFSPHYGDVSLQYLYIVHRDNHNIVNTWRSHDHKWCGITLDHDTGTIFWIRTHEFASPTAPTKYTLGRRTLKADGSGSFAEWGEGQVSISITADCPDADNIVFDSESNQVIVGSTSNNIVAFYDADTLSLLSTMSVNMPTGKMKSAWRQGVKDGYLYHAVHSPDSVQRINVTAYSSDQMWTLDDSNVVWDGGSCYDPVTHSMIIGAEINGDPGFLKMLLDRSGSAKIELSSLIEGICESVGLDPATDLDTTGLTDLVYGFVMNDTMRARAAIQVLMDAFFFDAIESDGLLKFVKRGGAVVADIPEIDLAAHVAGEAQTQRLITTRVHELDLPYEIDVMYIDPLANYVTGMQRERRLVTAGHGIVKMRVPVVLEADDAKQICVKHLALAWTARTSHQFELSRKYAYLEPGDVITVTEGGLQHTLRIQQIDYGGPVLAVQAVDEDATVYESDAEGTVIDVEDEEVDYPGASYMTIVDSPLTSSSHATPGVYLAVMGYTTAWQGAVVWKSPPLGAI